MNTRVLLMLVFLTFSFSSTVLAEEAKDNVLEIMCKQVLSSQLDLSPKVLIEAAKEKLVELPSEILSKAIDTLSEAPEALAEKIESFKKPVGEASPTQVLAKKFVPSENIANSAGQDNLNNESLLASVSNAGLDFASVLVRNWYWTLAGLLLVYLFFKFY